MALGLVLAIGPDHSPKLSWIARSLGEHGLLSGTIIGSGVLCACLALLSDQVRRVGTQMRTAEEAIHCTQALSLGMRQLVDRISLLHVELGELKEGQKAHLRLAQEQASAQTSGMQVDATYRLAASMDQLGRRFEDRMKSQETTFEGRFLDLLGSISATQEQLHGMLEEAPARLGPDGRLDARARIVPDDLLDAPPAALPCDLELEPSFREELDDGEELEISVELEEDSSPDGDAPDVASFDWDKVKLPVREEELSAMDNGLGLLDELDQDGIDPTVREGIARSGAELFSEEALEEAWQAFRRRTTED